MKSFYEYLSGVKKEYKYKLKLAVQVDDSVLDRVEKVLKRYDLIDISKPKKSILQRNEVDFPNLGPVESWSMTIVTDRPFVVQALTNEISKALNISEQHIRVRGENEPVAVEERFAEEFAAIEDKAGDMKPATLLGNDEVEEPTVVAYGDNYNQSLLNYLGQLQANRAEEMEKASDHKSMFGWLDSQTAIEDGGFNTETGGIRPVSGSTLSAKEAKAPLDTAPSGNFDSRIKNASKTYKDSKGLKKIEGK